MLDEIENLKQYEAYPYQRRPAPRGRPQLRIAETLNRLRALFPRQEANAPIWEYVAVLARVTFSDALGPNFDGARARALVRSHRARHLTGNIVKGVIQIHLPSATRRTHVLISSCAASF